VIARINPDNLASIGVVTKAGFVPDGEHLSPRSGRQLQFAHRMVVPQ
jgi:ribosomal-protein-alanine N-acetyltransferase